MKTLRWMLVCVALLTAAIPLAGTVAAGGGQATTQKLDQIARQARDNVDASASALRALNPDEMNPEDRATWVRLSRDVAVRNGDRATLLALKDEADPLGRLPEAHIILAHAFVDHGDVAAAHAELGKIVGLEKVNTRDQRRYWALKAKMARLEGNVAAEREAIEHIVHELGKWLTKDCQFCHGDLKRPRETPLLDVQTPWFARRYVELLKQQGDAAKVKADAERRLAADSEDPDARILLGFSLQAQDDQVRAEAAFRAIPWIKLPDRTGAQPRAIFSWP